MSTRQVSALLLAAGFLVSATAAEALAHGAAARCGRACACQPCPPACRTVQRTVYVPQIVTEKRTVEMVQCSEEVRQRTCTVYRRVPETKTVEREYTVMVPQTRTKTVNYTVCKPVWEEVERQYTVMVPPTETRQATRRVCKMQPVTTTRTVCVDKGHWEKRCVEVPCRCARRLLRHRGRLHGCCGDGCTGTDCCGTTTRLRRVWVPEVVEQEVKATCYKPVWEEVPCEYTVTVCKPQTRTCRVRVCRMQSEQCTREVKYTVCVPEKRTCRREVTVCKWVPEEKTVSYTVRVPHKVEKEIEVRVCRMVPKTVEVKCCDPCRRCCVPAATCCGG